MCVCVCVRAPTISYFPYTITLFCHDGQMVITKPPFGY